MSIVRINSTDSSGCRPVATARTRRVCAAPCGSAMAKRWRENAPKAHHVCVGRAVHCGISREGQVANRLGPTCRWPVLFKASAAIVTSTLTTVASKVPSSISIRTIPILFFLILIIVIVVLFVVVALVASAAPALLITTGGSESAQECAWCGIAVQSTLHNSPARLTGEQLRACVPVPLLFRRGISKGVRFNPRGLAASCRVVPVPRCHGVRAGR